MNYTNGFDIDLVLPALRERLGWQQPIALGSPILNSENLNSISGRYFGDDFHSACTIQNIKASQVDLGITDDQFNTYLTKKQDGMITRSLSKVFQKVELLEQCLMFTRFGKNDLIIPNTGQWVLWAINVANDQSISTQINFGTFYFDGDATFNMYLFQDGIREPISTIEVTVEAWQHTEVDFSQLVLNFKTGNKYYFGYYQVELGDVHAIREQVDTLATTLCFEAYNVVANATTDGSYFDHNQQQYPALPSGVNLEIISFKDHTQRIIRMANFFDEVQGLQMAVFAIELINNSNRGNSDQRQSQQQSQQQFMELNQAFATKEAPLIPGLKANIIAEFKRLRDTFYPPMIPQSVNMNNCGNGMDSYEQDWLNRNRRVFENPGVLVS